MKVRRPEEFLKQRHPALRSLLVYGPNRGLVRDLADTAANLYCDDVKDPFQTAMFDENRLAEGIEQLMGEALTPALLGGQRLVWLKDCPDSRAKGVVEVAKTVASQDDPASFILIECGDLRPASAFRKAYEAKGEALQAIACYEDTPHILSGYISGLLADAGLRADRDGLLLMSAQSTGDRHIARRLVEKLITYMGDAGQVVSIQDVDACLADGAKLELADAVFAVANGQTEQADDLVVRLLERGETAIGLLRVAQSHFRKLETAAIAIAEGQSPDAAIEALRPPVFFRKKPEMSRQAQALPLGRIRASLKALYDAERLCKMSAIPVDAVLIQTLVRIAGVCSKRR